MRGHDIREFAWINTVVMIGLIIGLTFIVAWVTRIVYTPTPQEIKAVIEQAEKEQLRRLWTSANLTKRED